MQFRIYGPPELTRQLREDAETTERAQRLHTRARPSIARASASIALLDRALAKQRNRDEGINPWFGVGIEHLESPTRRVVGRESGRGVLTPEGVAPLEYLGGGRVLSVR